MQINVTDQINVLIDLQKVDTLIYHLKAELAKFPEQEAELGQILKDAQTESNMLEEQMKQKQVHQNELENDIQIKENLIEKYKGQQGQVKTNQEYSALTHEIEAAKADKSLTEDEVIKLLDEIEADKKKLDEAKGRYADAENAHKEALEKIKARSAEINAEIAKYDEQRKQYLPSVDPELLAQYELIISKRGGIAVVPLQGGSCGGCNLSFPPQVINEIKLKEKIIFCEACARIVFEE